MAEYIKATSLKKGNYGIKMSVKVKEFIKELEAIENEKGYANLEIMERKEPSEFGHTHYIKIDTYEPKQ